VAQRNRFTCEWCALQGPLPLHHSQCQAFSGPPDPQPSDAGYPVEMARSFWLARKRHAKACGVCFGRPPALAFLEFPPEPQELRARNLGRVVVQQFYRPPLVPVLLLQAGWEQGVRPQQSRGDQARIREWERTTRAPGAAARRWTCSGARNATHVPRNGNQWQPSAREGNAK
jgi:hypothetical protein